MTSLIASPDIAALVEAFPPPLPTKDQPSLLRSNSGNTLVKSEAILNDFRKLLEHKPARVKKEDLPRRLGVEKTDWILDYYDGDPPIRWNRSQTSIIPDPEWRKVIEDLQSQCRESFIEIRRFFDERDVEPLTSSGLDTLVEPQGLIAFPAFPGGDTTTSYVASQNLVDSTLRQLNAAIDGAKEDKVNLSVRLSSTPYPVLKDLADRSTTAEDLEIQNDEITYVPLGYASAQKEKAAAEEEIRIQTLFEKFENDDFVHIGTSSNVEDAKEIRRRYTGLHADVETPTILNAGTKGSVVVLPPLLNRMLQEMKDTAKDVAVASDVSELSAERMNDSTRSLLAAKSSEPTLAAHILHVPSYAEQITSALADAKAEREKLKHEESAKAFSEEVHIPAQLYAAGIECITDPKLKQSLHDYITSHFKEEVITGFAKIAKDHGWLANDKSKAREVDKLLERSKETKDMGELVTSMSKFAKKMKFDARNTDEDQMQIRDEILEKKATKDMQNMTRGSDVLQNLVWVLLSSASHKPALFMSPGKDTGRVIKEYSTLAPDEVATSEKLSAWRGKLKTGSESKDDLEDMRMLAKTVVTQMIENVGHNTINGNGE